MPSRSRTGAMIGWFFLACFGVALGGTACTSVQDARVIDGSGDGAITDRRERPTPARDWIEVESADRAHVERPSKSTRVPRDAGEVPTSAPHGSEPAPAGVLEIAPGLRVDRSNRTVFVDGFVAADVGFLEQVACAVGSREHESLVATEVAPSAIHAALLLAGFEPGTPGSWRWEHDVVERIAPTGSALSIDVLVPRDASPPSTDPDGPLVDGMRAVPIESWIVDANRDRPFPRSKFIFGGSEIRANPRYMGPGEHYVADQTGSIVGLVTFGDETVGLASVIADQEGVDAPEWAARTDAMPRSGTRVVLRLRPFDAR